MATTVNLFNTKSKTKDSRKADALAGEGSTADKLKKQREERKKRLDEIMKEIGR